MQLANSAALVNSTVAINVNNGLQFSPGVGIYYLGGLSGGNLLQLADTANNAIGLVVGGNGAATTFSGQITGPGSLTKTGAGNLVLSGSDSYAGGTTVNAGTLYVTNVSRLARRDELGRRSRRHVRLRPFDSAAPAAGHDSLAVSPGVAIAAVPEPGSLVLFATAALLAAFSTWRRRKRA